jgi:hypothetical protein
VGRGWAVIVLTKEAAARGWYVAFDGDAKRWLCGVLGWCVREVSNGFGLERWQMRGMEICSPSGALQIRVGVISYETEGRLCGGRVYGPEGGGAGWLTAACYVDVFQVAVRVWTDGGEASHLS